jgi:glycosyltransferase involved in cell wall biosynthesis
MAELTTVIPVFNGERYLPETLACLAAQTRKPDRLVILDNGSTDRTHEIVNGFSAIPCEFRRNGTNLRVLGNLNRCLELAAETRFLHLLMADDLVTPEFFAHVVPPLAEVRGRALGYSLNDEIDQTGRVIGPQVRRVAGPPRKVPLNDFLAPQSELATVLLPGVVLKTDFSPPICRFEDLPQVADGLFLAEWATHSEAILEVPEYLCQYRLHPFNASSRHMFDSRHFIRDEWRLIQAIRPWFRESGWRRFLRGWRLRILFAARAQVKIDMMRHLRPPLVPEFESVRRELAGPVACMAGTAAVRGRDLVRRLTGRSTRAEELMQICRS